MCINCDSNLRWLTRIFFFLVCAPPFSFGRYVAACGFVTCVGGVCTFVALCRAREHFFYESCKPSWQVTDYNENDKIHLNMYIIRRNNYLFVRIYTWQTFKLKLKTSAKRF